MSRLDMRHQPRRVLEELSERPVGQRRPRAREALRPLFSTVSESCNNSYAVTRGAQEDVRSMSSAYGDLDALQSFTLIGELIPYSLCDTNWSVVLWFFWTPFSEIIGAIHKITQRMCIYWRARVDLYNMKILWFKRLLNGLLRGPGRS